MSVPPCGKHRVFDPPPRRERAAGAPRRAPQHRRRTSADTCGAWAGADRCTADRESASALRSTRSAPHASSRGQVSLGASARHCAAPSALTPARAPPQPAPALQGVPVAPVPALDGVLDGVARPVPGAARLRLRTARPRPRATSPPGRATPPAGPAGTRTPTPPRVTAPAARAPRAEASPGGAPENTALTARSANATARAVGRAQSRAGVEPNLAGVPEQRRPFPERPGGSVGAERRPRREPRVQVQVARRGEAERRIAVIASGRAPRAPAARCAPQREVLGELARSARRGPRA